MGADLPESCRYTPGGKHSMGSRLGWPVCGRMVVLGNDAVAL